MLKKFHLSPARGALNVKTAQHVILHQNSLTESITPQQRHLIPNDRNTNTDVD